MHIPRRLGRKIHRIQEKIHRAGGLNSVPVLLRWTEMTIPEGYNPHIETSPQPVCVDRTETISAFVHYVGIATTGYMRFTQIRKGDVILDFMGDVMLDDKPHLQFEFGGGIYVQKDGGDELAKSWDVRCNGVPVTRTLLVTPKA